MTLNTGQRLLSLFPLLLLSIGALRDDLVGQETKQGSFIPSTRVVSAEQSNVHLLRTRTVDDLELSRHENAESVHRHIRRRCPSFRSVRWSGVSRHWSVDCSDPHRLDVRPLTAEVLVTFGFRPDDAEPTEGFWSRIPGVGPVLASRIQKHWLLASSERVNPLCKIQNVRGVGPKLASKIWKFSRYADSCTAR